MKSTFLNPLGICIILVVLLSLNACAPPPLRTSPISSLNTTHREKIPLRVGYYIQPEYCAWIWRADPPYIYSYFFGETICNGVETMLVTAFRDVVRLSSVNTDLKSQNINALVAPEILQVDINTNRNTVFIKMKWTIRDDDNNILWADTITGSAHEICMAKWCRIRIVESAFQEQFQKAFESVLRQEWWQSVMKE